MAWSELVRALPFGRKTSPELLSAAARSGALGLLAAAEDQNKGGVREVCSARGRGWEVSCGLGEAHLAGVEGGRRQQWRSKLRQPGGVIRARV